MSLSRVLGSAPAAALGFVISLSGCIIETDDGWEPHHDCSVDARTSGAYDGRITAIDGCTNGAMYVAIGDAAPEIELRAGVIPKDGFPFHHLEIALFGPLEEEGEGAAAMITATTNDGVSWVTPDGACTASYVAEPCDDPIDDQVDQAGRRHTITDVDCSEPAAAEDEPDLVIEEFRINSSCHSETRR